VHDFNGKIVTHSVFGEFPANFALLADEDDLDAQVPGCANRAFDLGLGGVVSAHCIHSNGEHVGSKLLLLDFHYFTALILTAMRANTVRKFRLVAVGTLRKAGRLQRVVGAAVIGAPLRMSAFGIWHISSLIP
jgi:hypothetical protein